MNKMLYVLSIVFALVACAGGFVGERSLIYNDSSDAAYITVMREANWIGGGSNMSFELDGKEFGKLASGEYVTFPVSPDTHYIHAYSYLEKVAAQPRGEYFIRMRWGKLFSTEAFVLEALTSEEGKSELSSGNYREIKF